MAHLKRCAIFYGPNFDEKCVFLQPQRLEAKLEADYLCWYDIPIGARNTHPDFVILHPRRGLLVLEVKDWKPETIQSMTRSDTVILTPNGAKSVMNPLEQARQYAHAVVKILESDSQLVFSDSGERGKLIFPWAYGVVFTGITREVFQSSGLCNVIEPHRVLCQDEITESIDAEAFQQRLWEMFRVRFSSALHLSQLDRIRWHLFPEVRISSTQGTLFDDAHLDIDPSRLPDFIRVMDLQQEQLARSLGEGHRVIHGVAGSGKTLILGYRAEQLAKASTKPILVLCYNKTLAAQLDQWMQAKNVGNKINVRNFHGWCRDQLVSYHVDLPSKDLPADMMMAEMVQRVIEATSRGQIPSGQYDAVLIDEGHDFRPEWLKLVVQMIDSRSNSLLVLYDDAQSIYDAGRKRNFSFKSVGIQAQGRTTILRINYRNTREILAFAARFAQSCLNSSEADDDGVPRLTPVSGGRHGNEPFVIQLPTLSEEGAWIAARLKEEHERGTPWRDMAVLYRNYRPVGSTVLNQLKKADVPVSWQTNIRFDDKQDTVRMLTFHNSKGLEFPVVVIPGAGLMPSGAEASEEEARLLYVAMTRATERLILVGSGR